MAQLVPEMYRCQATLRFLGKLLALPETVEAAYNEVNDDEEM